MRNNNVQLSPVAKSVPFDNATPGATGLASKNAQGAIEEIRSIAAASAAPGFTFGRSGVLPPNTWLLNDTVPSNKSGRINYLSNCFISNVFIANEDPNIIKVEIYTHDGNEVNLTVIATITTLAQRTNTVSLNTAVPVNKQLAIRIASSSPSSGKNMNVGLQLKGNV